MELWKLNKTLLINRAEGLSLERETALLGSPVECSCGFSAPSRTIRPMLDTGGFGRQLSWNATPIYQGLSNGLLLGSWGLSTRYCPWFGEFFFLQGNCVSAVKKAPMHKLWLNRRSCPNAESLIPWVEMRMRSCIFKKGFERARISSLQKDQAGGFPGFLTWCSESGWELPMNRKSASAPYCTGTSSASDPSAIFFLELLFLHFLYMQNMICWPSYKVGYLKRKFSNSF